MIKIEKGPSWPVQKKTQGGVGWNATFDTRHLKGACVWCFIEWMNIASYFASSATVASESSFSCQASYLTTSGWLIRAFKSPLSSSDSLALIQEAFCLLSAGWVKPALVSWWMFTVRRGKPQCEWVKSRVYHCGWQKWQRANPLGLGHQAWVTPSGLHRERQWPVKAS